MADSDVKNFEAATILMDDKLFGQKFSIKVDMIGLFVCNLLNEETINGLCVLDDWKTESIKFLDDRDVVLLVKRI